MNAAVLHITVNEALDIEQRSPPSGKWMVYAFSDGHQPGMKIASKRGADCSGAESNCLANPASLICMKAPWEFRHAAQSANEMLPGFTSIMNMPYASSARRIA
jgi:hypothetical protein